MPRSSDGTYTLPSGTLVSTGDTILVSQHNPPMQDLEQAISGSLDRDGKGGMRADLPMGGQRITNLAAGVSDTDAATVGQLGSGGAIPIGSVIDYWGTTPPNGYLFAAGQEVSRATYASLFAVIGTNAGAGNGTTTFNLPDYRGRVGAGRDNMATPATTRLNTLSSSTLGATGGEQSVTLSSGQIPAHTHPVVDPGHSHGFQAGVGSGPDIGIRQTTSDSIQTIETVDATTGITVGANTGGGGAHNNVQPTIIVNKIIKVS